VDLSVFALKIKKPLAIIQAREDIFELRFDVGYAFPEGRNGSLVIRLRVCGWFLSSSGQFAYFGRFLSKTVWGEMMQNKVSVRFI
jgi:hypothetical protein